MRTNKKLMSLLLSLVLMLSMLTPMAFAEDSLPAKEPLKPDSWAVSELVDAEALGFPINDIIAAIKDELTPEMMKSVTASMMNKLKLLGENQAEVSIPQGKVITRNEFLTCVYDAVAKGNYGIKLDFKADAIAFFKESGILKGDSGEYQLDRTCTVQEASVFAARIVNYIYNITNNASKGMLWKAVKGENTLYLLGTIHVDRGNIYPFSEELIKAIQSSSEAIFEIDFQDQSGLEYYSKNTKYTDGTTLKDHISPELFAEVAKIYAGYGVPEAVFAEYRPWVIAGELSSLAMYTQKGEDGAVTGVSTPMVIDSYVYSKSFAEGLKISEVEGWKYQTDLFNNMSDKVQGEYLAGAVQAFNSAVNGEVTAEENGNDTIDKMLESWKKRDVESFNAVYNKDADLEAGGEFSQLLFIERDKHMSQYAMDKLNAEKGGTSILVVGLGHMVGKDGIVNVLLRNGYNVELVK